MQRATNDFSVSLLDKSGSDRIELLKSYHLVLSKCDQETVNLNSLERLKSELVCPSLLAAKDKSVRVLVACCLADILRL
jgi:sister-chromatid-cohesion protein PDS5